MNEERRRTLGRCSQDHKEGRRILSLLCGGGEARAPREAFYRRLEQLEATELQSTDEEGNRGEDRATPLTLQWPLSPTAPICAPFSELDRRTQFYLLFEEWQRRTGEGRSELASYQLITAQKIFEECLERARQLAVAELEARSLELLAEVDAYRREGPKHAPHTPRPGAAS